MSLLRAFLFITQLSIRRQLRSRKTLLALSISALLVIAVALIGRGRPWGPESFANAVVLRMLGLFLLPLITLIYGNAAIGDDVDEGTLVYLTTRPLPRWGLYLAKYLAALPPGIIIPLGCLKALEVASGVSLPAALSGEAGTPGVAGGSLWPLFAPTLALGALAYLAFFQALSVVFRRATLVSLAYVFFIEVFVGRMPGILKRGSICFYTWSMIYEKGAPLGLDPPQRALFLPLPADDAATVLAGATLALLALGMALFGLRNPAART